MAPAGVVRVCSRAREPRRTPPCPRAGSRPEAAPRASTPATPRRSSGPARHPPRSPAVAAPSTAATARRRRMPSPNVAGPHRKRPGGMPRAASAPTPPVPGSPVPGGAPLARTKSRVGHTTRRGIMVVARRVASRTRLSVPGRAVVAGTTTGFAGTTGFGGTTGLDAKAGLDAKTGMRVTPSIRSDSVRIAPIHARSSRIEGVLHTRMRRTSTRCTRSCRPRPSRPKWSPT